MPDKLFSQPLELTVDECTLRFCSASDIVFSLEGRTAVSSAKLSELFQLSTDQLQTQATFVEKTRKSLLSVLSRVAAEPDSIDILLRELDPLVFSQDRNWREIIMALHDGNEELNACRTTALSKYVKYLYSLEETIGAICSDRKQLHGESDNDDEDEDEDVTNLPPQLRSKPAPEPKTDIVYKRLPNDKEVTVKLPPGQRLEIRLASYECQLIATDYNVQLLDKNRKMDLRKGLNIVGRGSKSTVKIDAGQKNVSRSHLQVYISDDHTLQLTDLSSAGTFINSEFLP